jgi:rhamnosyltransferase
MNKINLPSVAVLLAAYNGRCYIEEQVGSILQQFGVAVTIFISVDLSPDDTHAWCQELAHKRTNIVVLPYGERFGGAAKNFFRLLRDVDFSGFDYIAFADQDDIWLQDKLCRAVAKIVETDSHGYSSNVMAFWPNGVRKLISKAQPQRAWDYLFEAAGPGCTYVIATPLALQIKSTVIQDWSEINKLALHDWFSYAYARAHGYAWFIDEWPSMLYRQHLGNEVGANKGFKAFRYRLGKVIGGWGIEQSALTAKSVGQGNAPFVRIWRDFGRSGFVKLAFSAGQCRRKAQDRVFFFIACLLLAVVGKH